MIATDAAAAIEVVERPGDPQLFRRHGESLEAARFLRDVQRLAADLPEAPYICNLCRDRYRFAVALVAAALRGQVCLLSSDRSPALLRSLGERFAGLVAVTDPPPAGAAAIGAAISEASQLPQHIVALPADTVAGAVANPALPVDRLVAIVFTSGSTGLPIGYPKTWGALAARSRTAARRFGLTGAAPAGVVGTVPAQHMYGFETTVLLPLHAAAASWSGPAFYPADIRVALRAMPEPRVLVTTPRQIRALLDADTSLPPLGCIISATAPLADELAAAAERRWNTSVLEIYGATEVGSIASRRTLDGPVWTAYDGVCLAPDLATDQMRVSAPYADPNLLPDLVEPLSPTTFSLLGRSADLVKLGGRRASLAGLNAILTSLPGVEDGVFVVPEDLERRPGARLQVFAIAPERTAEDILAELRRRIEPVFLPRRVIRLSALPRNETGKLPWAALLGLLSQSGDP